MTQNDKKKFNYKVIDFVDYYNFDVEFISIQYY
jgi:hypothetical protein